MKYHAFTLDPFQEKAFKALDEEKSIIVAAPTGCGKTLIAEYAAELSLKKEKRIIYTAPIKALSNQKFRDFRRIFGPDAVGINTGDVTLNPTGTILVMTTEIFRNLILEESPRLIDVDYVIFDEIHYLDDFERGTVWEESIILAPLSIKFLCLSATVPNIKELAKWMGNVRSTPITIIEETHRPVPLEHFLFSAKYGIISLKSIKKKFRKKLSERKRFLRRKPSSRKIIKFVLDKGHFPILYFCFNRRACERNADYYLKLNLLTDEEERTVKIMVDDLVSQYRLSEYNRLSKMKKLWEAGIAYHHAGILPAAKEIVERLFTEGLIKLLFCTETFALGINMPASSVIFDELEKYNGVDFQYLTTRQYNQMAGRAGRRGMDKVGFVFSQIIPEATHPKEIERILYGKNEKIESRFFASYSTILILYSRYGDAAFDIFRKSLRNYKNGKFLGTHSYKQEEIQIQNRIRFLKSAGFLDGTHLTEKGKLAAAVSGYEIQVAELYFSGCFDECSPKELSVILAALVTENDISKKKIAQAPHISIHSQAEKVIRRLVRKEIKHDIDFPIPEMNMSLAAPVLAWANGCLLKDLESFGIPEGDLVRLLRMTVQLLRVLRDRLEDPVISDHMNEALLLINRDVVDAQAELEIE
ncbi:MAG: DEAD/DEAH box helicase [bacterium]